MRITEKKKVRPLKNRETLPPNGITFDNIVFTDAVVPCGGVLKPCKMGTLPVTDETFAIVLPQVTGSRKREYCLLRPEHDGDFFWRNNFSHYLSAGWSNAIANKCVLTELLIASYMKTVSEDIDQNYLYTWGNAVVDGIAKRTTHRHISMDPFAGYGYHLAHIVSRIYYGTKVNMTHFEFDFSHGTFL